MTKKKHNKSAKSSPRASASIAVAQGARTGVAVAPSPQSVFIVEGVNFAATIGDTNDISTIRGSSLSLLRMVDAVSTALIRTSSSSTNGCKVAELSRGASSLELHISGPTMAAVDETVALLNSEFAAFNVEPNADGGQLDWSSRIDMSRFSVLTAHASSAELAPAVAAQPGRDTIPQLVAIARSRLRMQQLKTLTFAMPLSDDLQAWLDFSDLCEAGSGLPATRRSASTPVSTSVMRRREFGRSARPRVLADMIGDAASAIAGELKFVQSLTDLLPIDRERSALGIPPSVLGKIAIIHIDGNSFGKRRNALKGPGEMARFSQRLRQMQGRVVAHLVAQAGKSEAGALSALVRDDKVLRLEVLLLGGDELVIAVPAFCALDVFAAVQSELAKHRLEPDWLRNRYDHDMATLTHAAGIVFAGVKTPIRQLRSAAEDLVTLVKSAPDGQSSFATAILAMEGFTLPNRGAKQAIGQQYGLSSGDKVADAARFPGAALPGHPAPWQAQLDKLRHLQRGLPISQAIRINAIHRDAAGWEKSCLIDLNRIYGDGDRTKTIMAGLTAKELGFDQSRPWMPLRHYILLHDYLKCGVSQ